MRSRRPRGPSFARGGARVFRVTGALAILTLVGAGILYAAGSHTAREAATPSAPSAPVISSAAPPAAPTASRCTGVPLRSQGQVQPNTTYCGGRATSQIDLAPGDTWVGGEVTGVSTRVQQGAITCRSNCTLVNMDVHDNPRAFAGIDVAKGNAVNVSISGGRVTGSGSLGIGGGDVDGITIHDVEIDHNGGAANCSFEGGGFKGSDVHHLHFFNNYVHDNNCPGIWLDINSSNNEIDRNRVFNNGHEGILYEISQNASIHDNDIEGNGFHTDGNGCTWLWGGGITIASSFDIQVYGNALKGNCNGITGTQQDRRDSTPPAHLLAGLTVHDNSISGPGETGVAADNGADLATRAIVFANNAASGGASLCGLCG